MLAGKPLGEQQNISMKDIIGKVKEKTGVFMGMIGWYDIQQVRLLEPLQLWTMVAKLQLVEALACPIHAAIAKQACMLPCVRPQVLDG